MLFAEVLPDPNHYSSIGWLIVSLAGIAVAANSILKLVDRFTGKGREITPQPLEVRAAAEFMRKQECDVHRNDIIRRLDEQDRDRSELRKIIHDDRAANEHAARTRSAGIYQAINKVRDDLTERITEVRDEMAKAAQDTERALGRIEGKLDK